MVKIKDFSKFKTPRAVELPHLLEIQKNAWRRFWERDFKNLLKEVSPVLDYTKKNFALYFVDYRLGKPNYSSDLEAKYHQDTYGVPLFIKVKLVNLKENTSQEQEIFFGNFPLMTERGSFVINGVDRTTISQLIRSPGPLFVRERFLGRDYFGAQIIPVRGAWLEFFSEPNNQISVRIDRRKKVLATVLLKAVGYDKEIETLFKDLPQGEIDWIGETLKRDKTKDQEEAWIEIYEKLRPGDIVTLDAARDYFSNLFFNFERYDLSPVGRWRFWQRLPETKPKKENAEITLAERVLKPIDVLATLREIVRLNNTPGSKEDEVDHLGNRRVRLFVEVLTERLRVAFHRISRYAKDKMATLDPKTLTPSALINPNPFSAIVSEIFSSSQLAQFMDNENCLSELEHKRRLTASGPGGLTKERAGFEVRDVQPSHYGKICPIQTPEGTNIGLTTYLSRFAKVNDYGFLETPYYKVEKGKIDFSKVYYLNAYEEERYIIGSAKVNFDPKTHKILDKVVEARIYGKPGTIEADKLDYLDVSPEQALSVAASLIPFLNHTDVNRSQMGANMQKQAVPLLNPEVPLVMTGVESEVARHSGQILVSEHEGTVSYVDSLCIKIKTKDQKEVTYPLRRFVRTNQYTCLDQKPLVKVGQKVKKGTILTDGGGIKQGFLALGVNLLIGFLPWRGYTFEDALVISERLKKQDILSSIYLETFECSVKETKLGPEILTSDIPHVSEEKLRHLDEQGIVQIGTRVKPGDILVGKISPKGEVELSPEERLMQAIFGEKAKEVKDTSLRLKYGRRGRVTRVTILERKEGAALPPGTIKKVEVEIGEIRKIEEGDKLAGRYGNKGVISKILPEEDMPYLEDGTPLDIILSPVSIVSRMNLGQILEAMLGFAAKKLGYHAITPALSGATVEEIKKELERANLSPDGKVTLYDGRTGLPFKEKVVVGYLYVMKLIHMVEDKIHARSIGPYSLITQQPLGGRAQFGGQRFGEMEVWALEGHGAPHTLQEMLTIKSDDIDGRIKAYLSILKGEDIKEVTTPATFSLLVAELKSMGFNIIFEKE